MPPKETSLLLSMIGLYVLLALAVGSFTYFSSFYLAGLPLLVLAIGFLSALYLGPKAAKKFFAVGDILYYLVFGGFIGLVGLAASDADIFSKQINDQSLQKAIVRLNILEENLRTSEQELNQVKNEFAALKAETVNYCRKVLIDYHDHRVPLEPSCLQMLELNEHYIALAGDVSNLPNKISIAKGRVEKLTTAPEDIITEWLEKLFGGRHYLILQLVPSLLLSAVAHKLNKSFRTLVE